MIFSEKEMFTHTHTDVCLAMNTASSETSQGDRGETKGGTGLIFIIPSQLHTHLLIFNSPSS